MTLAITFVILAQFLIGFGFVTRLRAASNGFSLLGLSMLAGLGISSGLPFVLEFIHASIAIAPMMIGLGTLAGLSLLLLRGRLAYLREIFAWQRLSLRLCELPFLGFWAYLLFISAWKTAWYPNLPFDTIVGPDLVATFAVREHTLVSSVFTEHLPSVSIFSNQPFYAPFTAMQQIMYLLASHGTGPFAFGKIWLTILVIAFGLFLYAELRERTHPLLAGLLVTLLACSPELFAYTFLLQTDWANAAFFAAGVILLQRHLESEKQGMFIASTLFFALACWTRTETILFVPIASLLLLINTLRSSPKKAIVRAGALFITCLLPFVFWNYIFLRGYVALPANAHLGTYHLIVNDYFSKLLATYTSMNEQVVFDTDYWNYSVYVFLALALLNLILFRDKQGLPILVWIFGTYVLFGLLILHVDGANIAYTFRRGFFKILLLMYFYLGSTSLFQWLSNWLYRWEGQSTSFHKIY
ncbi:glycosyltransferase family 39 protein [Spirosoma validum]|uniref:Glycosyltransferase family 39 protein n=1 Tax=Spirosoma validum TaxID=2771355 RepID=A0A927B3Y1_9BACT|nr:glycosyltransferase family 39 protein [Spirosoma validum]MBD2755179.1 glycosyltransferase family 39 protein [Spirosoma validum]